MNERKFYDDYKDGKANYGVINLNKTYNRTTINKKISVIKNLQAFIDNKLDGENLVIEDFKTLTAENEIFKYALRNDDRRYTLGFGIHNNAKSKFMISAINSPQKQLFLLFFIPSLW